MKLGMTGTRNGISTYAMKAFNEFLVLNGSKITEAHHGDCIGADKTFHEVMSEMGTWIIVHPPNKTALRAYCKGSEIRKERDYLDRNKDIVRESDMLIAFPPTIEELQRSGTWSTIRFARKKGKRIVIIFPNGEFKTEGVDLC